MLCLAVCVCVCVQGLAAAAASDIISAISNVWSTHTEKSKKKSPH